VHNAVDDLTWVRGRHTTQVGANYRANTTIATTDSTAYKYANVNSQLPLRGSIAGTAAAWIPGAFGFPAVDASFKTATNSAIADATGLITACGGVSELRRFRKQPHAAGRRQLTKRHYLVKQFRVLPARRLGMKRNLTLTFG